MTDEETYEEKARRKAAWARGVASRQSGVKYDACPFPIFHANRDSWQKGWFAGAKDGSPL